MITETTATTSTSRMKAALTSFWFTPVIAWSSLLLASQLRWLVRHGYWPTFPLRIALAVAIGIAIGVLCGWVIRRSLLTGRLAPDTWAEMQRLAPALIVVVPGALLDPMFPGLTLAAILLIAAWGLEKEPARLRHWLGGLVSTGSHGAASISPRTQWLLFTVIAVLIVARAPELLVTPRIWAEDGTHTLAAMLNLSGLQAWLWYHEYYRLFSTIAGWMASRLVTLENAPLVFTLVALAVKMCAFAIVITGRSPLWNTVPRKLAVCAIILFTPHSDEIWLNVNGSHFYLALITALILCEMDQPASTLKRWSLRVLLGAAALGGTLPCLLAPLFWLRALHTRKRALFIGACIISAGTLVQWTALQLSPADMPRTSIASSTMAGWIILIKSMALPLGDGLAREAFRASRMVFSETGIPTSGQWLLAAQSVLVAMLAWRLRRDPALYLLGCAVILVVFTLLYGLGGTDQGVFRHPYLGNRYFYVPNVLLLLSIFAAVTVRERIAWRIPSAAAALVVVGVLAGNGYQSGLERNPWVDDFPDWRTEIGHWRDDPTYRPRAWPPAFRIEMDAVRRE